MGVKVMEPFHWDTCSDEVLRQASDTRLQMVALVVDQEGHEHKIFQPVQRGSSIDQVIDQARMITARCAEGQEISFGRSRIPYRLTGYNILLDGEIAYQLRLERNPNFKPEADDRGY
jgi:hypothetical protein